MLDLLHRCAFGPESWIRTKSVHSNNLEWTKTAISLSIKNFRDEKTLFSPKIIITYPTAVLVHFHIIQMCILAQILGTTLDQKCNCGPNPTPDIELLQTLFWTQNWTPMHFERNALRTIKSGASSKWSSRSWRRRIPLYLSSRLKFKPWMYSMYISGK